MFKILSILFFYAKIQARGDEMDKLVHDVMSLFNLTFYQALEFIESNKEDIDFIIEEAKKDV